MGASATQDEDIIIFNDESESEQLEIVNGQEPKAKQSVKKQEKTETKIVETEDLISFATDDEVAEKIDEKKNDIINTDVIIEQETTVEDSLIDLVSDEDSTETISETPSIEEQLKNLEISAEEHPIEVIEEKTEEISLEINETAAPIVAQDEEIKIEETEEISLELEIEEETGVSNEDLKAQLIEAQDQEDGVSFADMGIDLDKLGDSKWENLENIKVEAEIETTPTNSLEAETAVFWGVALLWLDDQKEEEVVAETDNIDLENDMGAFWDMIEQTEEIEEGTTHDWILESAILKLVNRDKAIDGEILKEEEVKSWKKDEIAELKKQIKALQWEVNDIETEIKELETEKATTNKTKEWLEKMKIAA